MKSALVSTTLIFSFPLLGEECVRALPTPLVDSKHSAVSTYTQTNNSKRELIEAVVLKTGLMFTIRHFGCAHFGLSYEFSMKGEHDRNLINQALVYLGDVENVAPRYTKFISEHLSKLPYDYATPEEIVITPGYDWIFLSVENADMLKKLTITYDIAL